MSGTVPIVKPEHPDQDDGLMLSEIVSVRLSAHDVADLNVLVREEQREASVLIRMALRAYIAERLGRVA